jgi:hypothetical protein
MVELKRASRELFRRSPDERFSTVAELWRHCQQAKQTSSECWELPQSLEPECHGEDVSVVLDDGKSFGLNDWSFTQLCRLACVSKDTLNRLTPATTSQALRETLPRTEKPIQLLTTDQQVRSLHGVAYTRLWNSDLLSMISEYATDFQPPPAGCNGATGLYCGEQDMFAFLIDPTGWAEIDGEAFAPGFFVWNSEVGRRSLGVQTFWFQAVCQNHIVWDAIEVVEFTRKHTANVHDGLREIRTIIERLVARRDERRDQFAQVLSKAMTERLGNDADEVLKTLTKHGIARHLARDATEIARQQGAFTIFSLVDALTRLTQKVRFAGDRVEADARVARLLALAA